jgi:hypothetical protein
MGYKRIAAAMDAGAQPSGGNGCTSGSIQLRRAETEKSRSVLKKAKRPVPAPFLRLKQQVHLLSQRQRGISRRQEKRTPRMKHCVIVS